MLRKRVYIAGPLGRGPERSANVERAVAAGMDVFRAGYAPLIPHLTHYIDPDDSHGYENWVDVDLAWVSAADAVLRLPGASPGADRETAHAAHIGVPVFSSIKALARGLC
jgi:hypothetical protein